MSDIIQCSVCGGETFGFRTDGVFCYDCGGFQNQKKPTKANYKVTVEADIYFGNLVYRYSGIKKTLKKFFEDNDGNPVDITFEAHNRVEHWQFKYIYGYLYKMIAEGMGYATATQYGEISRRDPGIIEIDTLMKNQFLSFNIDDESEIPSRHRSNCKVYYQEYKDDDGNIKIQVKKYIPSKSVLSYHDCRTFILKCEHHRDGLEGWGIEDESTVIEMDKIRERAVEQK